ncbi:fungal-specific transcription factor domain-containing protein [Cladorrhinum samala]|uniref:Fungal-specific transcription factor domain-containing protein n=1 Tax=Cladorrhinum samala TaxID=585594 RepID=A0AAV9I2P7_9PEZI|nr:fungal-specific transcription factor domain-containing protein [Cladorrhinum samala]
MPTVSELLQQTGNGKPAPVRPPAQEALMFAIYFAAVNSLEDSDVAKNLGSSKDELSRAYRAGFEYALAKTNFLGSPSLMIVQALTIFLFLVRCKDSSRFVWMMTGLAIRMAQSLGLHREASKMKHLSPYEIEIRRRVWWALCFLDVRTSEDQGTELTISHGSFDTKLPMNINDTDIDPNSTDTPKERQGLTDMSHALYCFEVAALAQKMMRPSLDNPQDMDSMLDDLYATFQQRCLNRHGVATEQPDARYWIGITVSRLIVAKTRLILHFPALLASPDKQLDMPIKVRDRLFVSAIEIAELIHALNVQQDIGGWKWICHSYTHWHAIIFLLLETTQRQWSPTVERAWSALHSEWLIPSKSSLERGPRFWTPLQRLIAKARRHREEELERLRGDQEAAKALVVEDARSILFASDGPFPDVSANLSRTRWQGLIGLDRAAIQPTPSSASGDLTQDPRHLLQIPQRGFSTLINSRVGSTERDLCDAITSSSTPLGFPSPSSLFASPLSEGQPFPLPRFASWFGASDSGILGNQLPTPDFGQSSMEVDDTVDWFAWLGSAGMMEHQGSRDQDGGGGWGEQSN